MVALEPANAREAQEEPLGSSAPSTAVPGSPEPARAAAPEAAEVVWLMRGQGGRGARLWRGRGATVAHEGTLESCLQLGELSRPGRWFGGVGWPSPSAATPQGKSASLWPGWPQAMIWQPAQLFPWSPSSPGAALGVAGGEHLRSLPPAPADEGREAWISRVRSAREAMGQGGIQKVVLARSQTLLPPEGTWWSPEATLQAMAVGHPSGMPFAVRPPSVADASVLVGVTPEWLVQKRGRRLTTVALAGTRPLEVIRREGPGALLDSQKDRHEHAVVVEAIRDALGPWSSHLTIPPVPELRILETVAHLQSPIEAHLKGDSHILEWVERLHPTPAVCGSPRREVSQWLLNHEPTERGWYAGALGWFDERGDGEFLVALRCALVHPLRATLFAGAGIMPDSDPEREWDETGWKLGTARHALRTVPANGRGANTSAEAAGLSSEGWREPLRELA